MDSLTLTSFAAALGAGALSFFSPCTLPVLPVYMGILASNAEEKGKLARFMHALAFVAGLIVVLVALGLGAGAVGSALASPTFRIAAGILVMLLGIYSTGFVRIPALERERRVDSSKSGATGILASFLMGAAFSFSWTPCVGPVLAAVLALAAQEGGALAGGILLGAYGIGLGLPFLAIALGSDGLLARIKGLGPHLPKIKAVGGVLIAAMGLWMVLSQTQALSASAEAQAQAVPASSEAARSSSSERKAQGIDFTLPTLEGGEVTLSDYRGKPVIIKFWATWCPPCLEGLPHYQELFEEYEQSGEAVVLSAVTPGLGRELSQEGVASFMDENSYSFPVLLDNGAVFRQFGIQYYPTFAIISPEGELTESFSGDPGAATLRAKLNALAAISNSKAANT